MFTGIIENTGIVKEVIHNAGNKTFWISSPLWAELKIDQSLSHDGVCLTVEEIREGMHRVTAIAETLIKTCLGNWENGTAINLEQSMKLNRRLDGHIVQGHVDCVAECIGILENEGSWEFQFAFDKTFSALIIEKGSVTVNGISLTCFNVDAGLFTVAVIPYTFQNTNIRLLKIGSTVNIEWDIVGKYISRMISLKAQ